MARSRVALPILAVITVLGLTLSACGSTDRSAAAPEESSSTPTPQESSPSLPSDNSETPVSAEPGPASLSVASSPVPPRVRWQSVSHGFRLWLRPGQNSAPVTSFEAVAAPAMGQAPAEGTQETTCWPSPSQPEAECTLGARPGQHEVWVRSVSGSNASPWLVVTVKADPGRCTSVDVARGYCAIGDIGPGGGFVFYDAGEEQKWGRYLEAAPAGWSGSPSDPKVAWCGINEEAYYYNRPKDPRIGAGAANTRTIIQDCGINNAAGLSASYRVLKSDWYLPSVDELTAMMSYRTQIGISQDPLDYWTSTQWTEVTSGYFAGVSNIYYDDEYALVGNRDRRQKKDLSQFVRPIRAF